MALVALLSAREASRDPSPLGLAGPLIDFGGQPLVEYQSRLALKAGAERILIYVDAAAADLARLVDRLTADHDCPIALVQDMPVLGRSFGPDDEILLLAENLVLPAEALDALLDAGPSALLALPPVPATSDFERIDSEAMWAGALCLPGQAVLATLDMLGDWDLSLTLLRRAVQGGVQRVFLSPELVMDGRLTLVRGQDSADIALQVLSTQDPASDADRSGGLASLLAPVSRPIVRELVRRQLEPARLGIGGVVLAVVGLALGIAGWAILALVVLMLAGGAVELGRQCALVTLRPAGPPWRQRFVQGLSLALLALLGFRLAQGQILGLAGAWLPVLLIGLFALARERLPTSTGLWSRWAEFTPSSALALILTGYLLGMAPATFALLGLVAVLIVMLRILPVDPHKV